MTRIKTERRQGITKFALGVSLFIVGVLVGAVFFRQYQSPCDLRSPSSFTNPSLICAKKRHALNKGNMSVFEAKLSTFIEEERMNGGADTVAVYFRDLEQGPTFGINERVDFIPASLLKLPLAFAIIDRAETDPEIYEASIPFTGYDASFIPRTQTFGPKETLEVGERRTVKDLLFRMLAYSDNAAYVALYTYVQKELGGEAAITQTYRDLGIIDPGGDIAKSGVNAKGYASIFRQLYNASFVDQEASEQVLAMLSESQFTKGLRMGVPAKIRIAHKFGERFLDTGEKQLHDCGIIYYPGNPYLLCVMTRGRDFERLSTTIARISKTVFDEMESRRNAPRMR